MRLREAAARSAGGAGGRGRRGWRRRWRRGRCAARATGRRSAPATGSSCAPPGRSPAPSASWPSSAPLAPGAGGAGGDDRRARVPRLERPGRGPGADRQPLPPARRPLRPRPRRLAAGRRVPAPRPRRRPLPLRGPARARSGSTPRRDTEAEERYLFGVCLALPRRRLFLSYRDSDENGGAESRSPLLDEVRALLAPAPDGASPTRSRRRSPAAATWPRVVHPLAEAPSEDELARALAAHGAERRRRRRCWPRSASTASCAAPRSPRRIAAARARRGRLARARAADQPGGDRLAGRGPRLRRHHPGGLRRLLLPLVRQPRARPAAARPGARPAGPGRPDARRRSTASTRSAPAATPSPAPAPSPPGSRAGARSLAAVVAERELGSHPAERAMARRVERLLERFLAEEAGRETGGFEPWLLEAALRRRRGRRAAGPGARTAGACTGRSTGSTAPPTAAPSSIDYKLSGAVTPREKFEEQAKLQLPLYLLAVAEHWGARAGRRPLPPAARDLDAAPARGRRRGGAPGDLAGYDLYGRDVVDAEELEELLADSRRRGGEIVARMRAGDIRRDPGPRRGPARPRRLPPLLRLRADLPPRPRPRSTRRTRRWRSGERARAPTPEQAAAIEVGGRDVLLEAGAGTGKTGVMVDRYCRLVCDEGVSPDAILAFTFTDKAAAELRQRIRAELARRAEAGLRAGGGAAERDRRRLGDDDPRLLQPRSWPPTRSPPGSTPASASSTPPRPTRAAREAFDEALAEFLAEPASRAARGDRRRLSTSKGCGGSSSASTPSCAAAARPSRGCRSRRRATRSRRSRAAIEAAGRGAGGAEGERPQTRAGRAGAGAPERSPGRRRRWTSCERCAPAARRRRSRPTAKRSTRRSRAPPRRARAASPTATWPSCWSSSRPASRRPRSAAPGSTSRTCRSSPRGCSSGPRSARPTAARFSHLLVDEFQDTNRLQLRLIEALRGPAQRAGRGRRRAPVDLRLPPRRPRRLPPPARADRRSAPTPS